MFEHSQLKCYTFRDNLRYFTGIFCTLTTADTQLYLEKLKNFATWLTCSQRELFNFNVKNTYFFLNKEMSIFMHLLIL